MSKRSKVPELELKRLLRQVKLLEIKYEFAVKDGKHLVQKTLLRKAEHLAQRIGVLKAILQPQPQPKPEESVENVVPVVRPEVKSSFWTFIKSFLRRIKCYL